MKCTILGGPGTYEPALVHHTVRHHGNVIVIDHVPADECDVCGDVLLAPETVRRIEELLSALPQPRHSAPIYEYA